MNKKIAIKSLLIGSLALVLALISFLLLDYENFAEINKKGMGILNDDLVQIFDKYNLKSRYREKRNVVAHDQQYYKYKIDGEIENILIDFNKMNIDVYESDEFSLEIKSNETIEIDKRLKIFESNGDSLHIREVIKSAPTKQFYMSLRINIPKEELIRLKVDLKDGNIVTRNNFDELDVKMGNGNVSLYSTDSYDSKVDLENGNINVKMVNYNARFKLNTRYGIIVTFKDILRTNSGVDNPKLISFGSGEDRMDLKTGLGHIFIK